MLLVSAMFPIIVTFAHATTVSEVASELICQCGCGLTVENCNHDNCPSAIPMRAEINKMIGQGLSKSQIIQSFVSKYGERVLAAPTKKGFNITAWVTPFIAIIISGALIYLAVNNWAKNKRIAIPEKRKNKQKISENDDKYHELLEKELKNID